jgi:glucosamine kinase
VVVIGIDAGGTKTVCRLADGEGRVLAESRGPGANLQNAGELEVERVLHQVITEATRGAADWPSAVCLGMAGVDRARDAGVVQEILRRIMPRTRVVVVNDALVALEAGVPGSPGVVLIAGTGSIAYGRNAEGRAARAGGWGYLLGDEGSGFWLGRQALRAVVRSADGRAPHTRLTARVLAHFGIARTQDLVREIYDGSFTPATVAAIASEVEGAAAEGDEVALHLIDTGASELGLAALSVCSQLRLPRGPVVLAGGMFTAAPRLRQRVTAHLMGRWPGMVVTPLQGQPVGGAVLLALAEAAGTLKLPAYVET